MRRESVLTSEILIRARTNVNMTVVRLKHAEVVRFLPLTSLLCRYHPMKIQYRATILFFSFSFYLCLFAPGKAIDHNVHANIKLLILERLLAGFPCFTFF